MTLELAKTVGLRNAKTGTKQKPLEGEKLRENRLSHHPTWRMTQSGFDWI